MVTAHGGFFAAVHPARGGASVRPALHVPCLLSSCLSVSQYNAYSSIAHGPCFHDCHVMSCHDSLGCITINMIGTDTDMTGRYDESAWARRRAVRRL